ncbi:aldo/keto reductase, partial [Bacillus cereus]|nr:aldo/keto reductase [Bacillus cereus]
MNHQIPEKVLNDGTKVPVIGFGTVGFKGADGVQAITGAIDAGYR